jgi:peptidoglycan/xylan/chitin deacetylase (PgdA/CDA1 family)
MTQEVLRAYTLHAERLDRPDVWHRTSHLLEAMEARRARATIFVDPSVAIDAGIDIGSHIRALLGRGHEIGLRTRWDLPPAPADAGTRAEPATPDNVRRCLERDLDYLRTAGADPRGFVAGGWAIPQAALTWLRERDFAYDASVRSFPIRDEPEAAADNGWTRPRLEDGLVRLPTTSLLIQIAQRRGHPLDAGTFRYELGFIHDYDLTSVPHRMAAGAALRRWGEGIIVPAATLAERLLSNRDIG